MRTGLAGLRGRLAVAGRCGAGVGRVAGLQPLGQQDLDPGGDRDGHQGADQSHGRSADQEASSTAPALSRTGPRMIRGAIR
jgi:hypothetical protein